MIRQISGSCALAEYRDGKAKVLALAPRVGASPKDARFPYLYKRAIHHSSLATILSALKCLTKHRTRPKEVAQRRSVQGTTSQREA